MNKNLGTLIGLGLNLELFYNVSISKYEITLQSHNTEDLRNHLFENGFVKYNYLYSEDNVENSEYHIPDLYIRVLLIGKESRF
jgi:hypothetical protein